MRFPMPFPDLRRGFREIRSADRLELRHSTCGSILVQFDSRQRKYRISLRIPNRKRTGWHSNVSLIIQKSTWNWSSSRHWCWCFRFDTSAGRVIFEDQFLQISTLLPSEDVYGFGENTHETFRHDFSAALTFVLSAKDEPPFGVSILPLPRMHPSLLESFKRYYISQAYLYEFSMQTNSEWNK